jgi:hypothetical protein
MALCQQNTTDRPCRYQHRLVGIHAPPRSPRVVRHL